MKKKMLSLALTLVMCLGLTVPAFAVYTLEITSFAGVGNVLEPCGLWTYPRLAGGRLLHSQDLFRLR